MDEVERTNGKLAQFKNAIYQIRFDNNTSYDLEWIFERTNSSDKKILCTKYLQLHHPELIGDTALHIAIKECNVFDILLDKKIGLDHYSSCICDKFRHNDVCLTIVEKHYNDLNIFSDPRYKLPNLLIRSMLNVYKNCQNFANLSDKNGISHFHVACMANDSEMIELYLNNGVFIDHAVNSDSPHFPEYTPLHFAVKCCSMQTVQLLLERNANLHLKDAKGMSALHILLENHIEFAATARKRSISKSKEEATEDIDYGSTFRSHSYKLSPDCYAEDYLKLKSEEIIRLFLKKYSQENMLLIDDSGLSYFHLVCTVRNTSLDTLKNEADLNHCINKDSPLWPGYSPLHFAALVNNVDTMKVLIEKGGDMGVKDAKGITPFDICVDIYETKDIYTLLLLHPTWKNICFSDGKTKLLNLVAAIEKKYDYKSFFKEMPEDFDIYIPYNSPLWPGFTPMHLAIICSKNCNENANYFDEPKIITYIFHRNPKSIYMQKLHVSTPLDFAFRRKKTDAVRDLLSSYRSLEHYLDNVDDNQLSCLHVACATGDHSLVQKLLSWGNDVNVVYKGKPFDSVNSGWTPLHFAVANCRNSLIEILCQHGANVFAKDINDMTPIHLMIAFSKNNEYEYDERTIDNLFSFSNFVDAVADGIGVSHLHVACFYGHKIAVEKLVENGADINKVINYKPISADNGSTILSDLTEFDGSTPLYLALQHGDEEILKFLLQCGADVFLKSRDAKALLLCDILENLCSDHAYYSDQLFFPILIGSNHLQKRVEREIGLTMLHVACRMDDVKSAKELLDSGADVNAQIHINSPIWPGCAPLHTLDYRVCQDSIITVHEMLMLFLDRGADVTLSNAEGETPVHMAYKHCYVIRGDDDYLFVSSLLKAHRDFSINPKSVEGVTHFHVACYLNDLFIIKKFLRHAKIDVNQPINYFTDEYRYVNGCTPLHLAVSKRTYSEVSQVASRLEVVDLLLNRGADVHVEDVHGDTPLNKAVKCNPKKCQDLLERLARNGADLNVANIFGKTPLEYLVLMESEFIDRNFDVTAEEIKNVLKYGCHFNQYNPATGKAYIALALSRLSYQDMQELIAVIHINFPNVMKTKYKGRTAIHNIVSGKASNVSAAEYTALIDQLSRFDCDVDDQDDKGQTALHLAVHHQNYIAVCALTIAGADMSIRDSSGKAAFNYNPKTCRQCDSKDRVSTENNDENGADVRKCDHVKIDQTFLSYVLKLQLCGSYVQLLDEYLGYETRGVDDPMVHLDGDFSAQVKVSQKLKIGSSTVNFGDFLSETGTIVNYSTMSSFDREAIDDFFSSDEMQGFREKFYEVACIIQFQYRKAVRRNLMEASKNVLVTLTGYRLPDLCSECILQRLGNSDLENLVASMS